MLAKAISVVRSRLDAERETLKNAQERLTEAQKGLEQATRLLNGCKQNVENCTIAITELETGLKVLTNSQGIVDRAGG